MASSKAMSGLIDTSRIVPKVLFRLNKGTSISLRDRTVKPRGLYDLTTENGMVKPKALDPQSYRGRAARCIAANLDADIPQLPMAPHFARRRSVSRDRSVSRNRSVIWQPPITSSIPSRQVCASKFKSKRSSGKTYPSPATQLPDDLILVHERYQHYSLQPAKLMSLQGTSEK